MNIRVALLCVVVLPLAACAQADSAPGAAAPPTASAPPGPAIAREAVAAGDPRIALAAKVPGAKPEDLRATPVPGIYELTHGADISYISADGAYVFAGDMYKVSATGEFPNLSEDRRRAMRLKLLAGLPESQMLVFGPDKPKYTITVFTDVDCTYCRRLHSQIDQYNALGIRVRYAFFPRTGPDTESWFKAETVWCSADRKATFTKAKLGKDLDLKKCPDAPVALEYQLGKDLGITGTPGVVLESGELIPGYMPPADMISHLREEAAKAVGAPAAKKK